MVVKKQILKTIIKLDSLYNSAPTVEATYYSKLAIIELCGWIELTMDNIVQDFANKKLKTQPFKNSFKALKESNYGFEYKKNFRKMLSQTIGIHNMEKIEVKLSKNGSIAILDSTLDNLKIIRNDAAHSYIEATTTYQAPSVTKSQLILIYPILKDFNREVKLIK